MSSAATHAVKKRPPLPDISDHVERLVRIKRGADDQQVDQLCQTIAEVLAPFPTKTRQRIVHNVSSKFEQEQLKAKPAAEQSAKADIERRLAVIDELRQWAPIMVLERNDCSRLHKLKEAAQINRIIDGAETAGEMTEVGAQAILAGDHTFVVKHDWAQAFEDAEGIDDSFRLPYEITVFEFRISGHTVIVYAIEEDGEHPKQFTMLIECGEYWLSPPALADAPPGLSKFVWSQVRSICIALDAEVATETVIRQPTKLNEKRARSGKIPLSDYRVVDLARRHRIANPASAGSGSRKRLHFRRGHWRHYEASKTWVRWCLVGDPDLGFIQKHYSL